MLTCSDCQKTAAGNCGRHLESYMGAVAHPEARAPKSTDDLIEEAVAIALLQEKAKWMEIMHAWKRGTPKNHIPCGCTKCFALGQALQKAPVYLEIPVQ